MATIKDVSRVSGLSVGTISRYLNGNQVKKENQLKIETAINELNYEVNPIARGLKTNKTYTIGVLVPSITDIISNQVIEGMEEIFDNKNYSLIICNSRNELKGEIDRLQFLKQKRVDGIIMMPVSDHNKHVQDAINSGIPVVLIDRLLNEVVSDAVISDNVNGAYKAVEKLIIAGHRRIGIVSGPENVYTAKERLEGYKRALTDYQIPIEDSLIVYAEYKKGSGLKGYEQLLYMEDRPSVIFATNYETTMTGVKYFMENGIKVGEDISFFGFDNTDVFQMLTPTIATVYQATYEIGECAAEILLRRIESDYNGFPEIHRLKTKLLDGSSVKKMN